MRYILAIAIASVSLSLATGQEDPPKPAVSSNPLTAQQIAVYRAVLEDYSKGTNDSMNLANKTEALELAGPSSNDACFKEIELEHPTNAAPEVHQLGSSMALNSRFLLVDAEKQAKQIDENDPQKLMKKAIDDHERVSDKEVNISVKQAFKSGLFTLSEIAFDKEHRHAILAYSFVCGMLCGHGNTVILNKSGQKWKVAKRCGGWIS
jgi:hypothetical protein